jgi:hypothetical protein
MPKATLGEVLRLLHKTYPRHEARQRTDSELLNRFVTDGDEAAFTVLVERHGPVVQGVCRRVMGDFQAVEDSFQATFLVLARRAASIYSGNRWEAGFTPWLDGSPCAPKFRARPGGSGKGGQ